MENLKKYKLDYEKTINYALAHIGAGRTLSKQLIKNIDFSRGNFFTILPSNANLERLYVFTSGNIIPQEYPEIPMEDDQGNRYIYQEVMNTKQDLNKFILNYLEVNQSHLSIFEDVISSLTDHNLKINQVRLVTINNHPYHLADYLTPLLSVRETLWRTIEIWHTLIVLTKDLNSQSLPDILNIEDITLICDSTQYIIISAYDGESYIIWEKHGQTWQYPGFELTELPSNISFLEAKD
ncbi:MAG: hypothetical protein H0X51_10175 [Parachlamydiaceae bacterium]|nr:hypothetical protein [Tatlockia sp.]MBA3958742.1 hypothetical protein [Parachlamydiaceae bacterium]